MLVNKCKYSLVFSFHTPWMTHASDEYIKQLHMFVITQQNFDETIAE